MTRRGLLLSMPAYSPETPATNHRADGGRPRAGLHRRQPHARAHRMAEGRHFGRSSTGVMPSVTNANNASICCGVWPEKHGITANFYLDETTGREEYMESAGLVLAPTLFERAAARGREIRAAFVEEEDHHAAAARRELVLSAETPTAEWTERLGPAPDIYSAEINHWLLKAALWILRHQPDIGILYIHTTDYPMHMWPPEAEPLAASSRRARRSAGRTLPRPRPMPHPADRRSRHASQNALLGSDEGLRRARRAAPVRHLRRAGQVPQTSQRLRRNGVGVPEIETETPDRAAAVIEQALRRRGGADPERSRAPLPLDAFANRRTGRFGRSRHGLRQSGIRDGELARGVPQSRRVRRGNRTPRGIQC